MYIGVSSTNLNLRWLFTNQKKTAVYHVSLGDLTDSLLAAYTTHKAREHASLDMKAADMFIKDPKQRTVTFNLEALLTVPQCESKSLFYKRKLNLMNLTMYNNDARVECYLCRVSTGQEKHEKQENSEKFCIRARKLRKARK